MIKQQTYHYHLQVVGITSGVDQDHIFDSVRYVSLSVLAPTRQDDPLKSSSFIAFFIIILFLALGNAKNHDQSDTFHTLSIHLKNFNADFLSSSSLYSSVREIITTYYTVVVKFRSINRTDSIKPSTSSNQNRIVFDITAYQQLCTFQYRHKLMPIAYRGDRPSYDEITPVGFIRSKDQTRVHVTFTYRSAYTICRLTEYVISICMYVYMEVMLREAI